MTTKENTGSGRAELPVVERRPAIESDRVFLARVYASSRALEMEALPWTDEQKAVFLDSQFEAQLRHYRSEFPGGVHQILLLGGEAVGRLYYSLEQSLFLVLDVAVLPEFRGRGIGTRVMRECQAAAQVAGVPVRVYVDAFGPATSLFRGLGFEVLRSDGMNVVYEWSPSLDEVEG